MQFEGGSFKLNLVKAYLCKLIQPLNIKLLQPNKLLIYPKVHKLFSSIVKDAKPNTKAPPIRCVDNVDREYLHCSTHLVVPSLSGEEVPLVIFVVVVFTSFHYVLFAAASDD